VQQLRLKSPIMLPKPSLLLRWPLSFW